MKKKQSKNLVLWFDHVNEWGQGDVLNDVPRGYVETEPRSGVYIGAENQDTMLIKIPNEPARDVEDDDHLDFK